MKILLKQLLIALIIGFPLLISAQTEQTKLTKKPKVALVLSGGGAKGLAHIAVLQALDSLGIVPDLVIGTSMGSIVGALYSMGYSGDEIEKIATQANWDELLGGHISLKNVGIEAKSEFKKYMIDLDLVEGKPKMASSLLNDQNLREFLTLLTYSTFKIRNFDELPIPFRSMCTDIVNGKEVLLSDGSLSFAMRASMSIPGVFKPMPYKNTLLVDGGILNNFPTDVAEDMGADIIIGSDVGDGLQKIEELDNMVSLLFQASMLSSNVKNDERKARCDILFDHVPNLTYSTSDFNKSTILYNEGKIAVKNNLYKLVDLSKQLKGFKQIVVKAPDTIDSFILDTIVYSGISKENIDLVKARINIKTNKKYTTHQLIEGVNRAMGTNLFSEITYSSYLIEDKLAIEVKGVEISKNQVNGSMHYDNYRGIGLIANYTGRNLFGKTSRFLVTLDISEQPKYRVQYQKIFGKNKSFWWRSEAFGEFLEHKVFLNGQEVDNMKYRYFQFNNELNKNLNSQSSYIGFGLNHDYTKLKPKVDPDLNDNVLDLENYDFNSLEIYAQYVFTKMDKVYNATNGTNFRAFISRSLMHDMEIRYINNSDYDFKGATNGFTKLGINFEHRKNFSKHFTAIVGVSAIFIVQDQLKSDQADFSDFGYAKKYFIGGNIQNPRKGTYMFYGLKEDELVASQFMQLSLATQLNPFGKVYVTPHFDIASVGFNDFSEYIDTAFSPNGNWQEGFETSTLMSAGAMLSYKSFLGPINFDVSWVNDINRVRLFFSVGLVLNRSN